MVSNFAFNFNLRRYIEGEGYIKLPCEEFGDIDVTASVEITSVTDDLKNTIGRAVQVDPFKPTLKAPVTKRLKLQYDKLVSSVAFNFNLRRYTSAVLSGSPWRAP